MTILESTGERAVIASRDAAKLTINDKNKALELIARALTENADTILMANEIDMENGKKAGMKDSLLDRLKLTKERIEAMAEGALKVRALDDPTGEVIRMWENPNGLRIGQKRVPIGVIGIIYESRPNVTVDAFVLCFKAGNAAILKGGSDAINSNIAITSVIRKTLEECDINSDRIHLIEKTDRTVVDELLKLNQYIDVVIPRGGAGLINFVVNN